MKRLEKMITRRLDKLTSLLDECWRSNDQMTFRCRRRKTLERLVDEIEDLIIDYENYFFDQGKDWETMFYNDVQERISKIREDETWAWNENGYDWIDTSKYFFWEY